MSSRHVRWVLANRLRYADQIDRDIMVAIATHIGYDDKPARVGMAAIAEYAGVHFNTVDKRTKAMAERGDLIIGRAGRYCTYALPTDADDQTRTGDEPPPGHQSEDPTGLQEQIDELRAEVSSLRLDMKELKAMFTSLSHDVHTSLTRRSHDNHMSFTPAQRADVNKGEEEEEGGEGGKEGGSPSPPYPNGSPFGFRSSPVKPALKSPADKRVEAIAEVCGLDLSIPSHLRQCENAAAQLGRYDAEYIRGRYGSLDRGAVPAGWHWYTDDWRGQKGEQPTPKQVVSTIGRQRQEVPPSPRASPGEQRKVGSNEAAARQYAELKRKMRTANQKRSE